MIRLRLIGFLLAAVSALYGQTSSSLIEGTVTDSTGAAVPNAKITATLANTDTSYRTVTNSSGNYVIPNIRPGEYNLSVEATSFKRVMRTGILIEVNQSARADI